MRIFLAIALLVCTSSFSYGTELPSKINHLGVIGPGYLRLFESERRNFEGSKYIVISVETIRVIEGVFAKGLELEKSCNLIVNLGSTLKSLSTLNQDCGEIMNEINSSNELRK